MHIYSRDPAWLGKPKGNKIPKGIWVIKKKNVNSIKLAAGKTCQSYQSRAVQFRTNLNGPEKSRIRETKNLLTDADSRTITIL